MNYSKCDAALSSALYSVSKGLQGDELNISIRLSAAPTSEQLIYLTNLGGVRNVRRDQLIFTAELTMAKVELLSELSWVQRLALSWTSHTC